ncbi:MAG: hypothetical protein SF051_15860, partial [Elusimicrobiota bacterium]|nr:hypothetical protein [Elusimicrobiota bacterium]
MKSLRAALALTVAVSPIAHARVIARVPSFQPVAPRPSMPGFAGARPLVQPAGASLSPSLASALQAPSAARLVSPLAAPDARRAGVAADAPAMNPESPLARLAAAADAPRPSADAPAEDGRSAAARPFDGSAH